MASMAIANSCQAGASRAVSQLPASAKLSDVVKASCAGEYCVDASPELLRMAQIRLATYGPECRELPANWQMLGETKEKHGKYKEAVPYFERAVAAQKLINSKSKSKDSLDILFAMNLARALEKSGEKAKAQKLRM